MSQIGIYDDFFVLGGHSLLATRITSKIKDTLQLTLPIRSIFETPTIAGLAEQIATIRWTLDASKVSQSDAADREEFEL